MFHWKRIDDERSGYLYHLSESLALMLLREPGYLYPLDRSKFIIASDYSGQHSNASFEAHSYLVTTSTDIGNWIKAIKHFRNRSLPDRRTMSFKKLKEPVRRRALPGFLSTASLIGGNTFTFLISKDVKSFFGGEIAELREIYSDCFDERINDSTAERMLRRASFLAFLNAGLKNERQPSWWVSDNDETLETFERRENFGRLCSYLTFGLTRWHNPADCEFGTTGSPNAPDWAEDLCAIPDLVAGVFSSFADQLPGPQNRQSWQAKIPAELPRDVRVRQIGDWIVAGSKNLRHVVLRLDSFGGASAFGFKPQMRRSAFPIWSVG